MSLAFFNRPKRSIASNGSKQSADAACDCDVPAAFRRAARPKARLTRRVDWRGAVLPLVAIAIWWAVCEAHVIKSGLLVSPAQVLATAWQQIVSGALLKALSASLA